MAILDAEPYIKRMYSGCPLDISYQRREHNYTKHVQEPFVVTNVLVAYDEALDVAAKALQV